jgi:hypothetical protein
MMNDCCIALDMRTAMSSLFLTLRFRPQNVNETTSSSTSASRWADGKQAMPQRPSRPLLSLNNPPLPTNG